MKVLITKHGLKRIAQRKIAPEELKTTLLYGCCTKNDVISCRYDYADLKVITDFMGKIITVYRYDLEKDTRSGSTKKHFGRKARIQRRQRLNAMLNAEHYQEMRCCYAVGM